MTELMNNLMMGWVITILVLGVIILYIRVLKKNNYFYVGGLEEHYNNLKIQRLMPMGAPNIASFMGYPIDITKAANYNVKLHTKTELFADRYLAYCSARNQFIIFYVGAKNLPVVAAQVAFADFEKHKSPKASSATFQMNLVLVILGAMVLGTLLIVL